jgi:PIN domain nuclease of toxin-antitoxin system
MGIGVRDIPSGFLRDPADRLIYATAVESGSRLVSKDRRLHDHDPRGDVVVWWAPA